MRLSVHRLGTRLALLVLPLSLAACNGAIPPSGATATGGPGIVLLGLRSQATLEGPGGRLAHLPATGAIEPPILLFAATTTPVGNPRLLESLDGRTFTDTGIAPRPMTDGLLFEVPWSGGDATYYVTGEIGGESRRSNRIPARGLSGSTNAGVTSPRQGASGVVREPLFAWTRRPQVPSYLLVARTFTIRSNGRPDLTGIPYVVMTTRPEWAVESTVFAPVFVTRNGGRLPPLTIHRVEVFSLNDYGWATETTAPVDFTTRS